MRHRFPSSDHHYWKFFKFFSCFGYIINASSSSYLPLSFLVNLSSNENYMALRTGASFFIHNISPSIFHPLLVNSTENTFVELFSWILFSLTTLSEETVSNDFYTSLALFRLGLPNASCLLQLRY